MSRRRILFFVVLVDFSSFHAYISATLSSSMYASALRNCGSPMNSSDVISPVTDTNVPSAAPSTEAASTGRLVSATADMSTRPSFHQRTTKEARNKRIPTAIPLMDAMMFWRYPVS